MTYIKPNLKYLLLRVSRSYGRYQAVCKLLIFVFLNFLATFFVSNENFTPHFCHFLIFFVISQFSPIIFTAFDPSFSVRYKVKPSRCFGDFTEKLSSKTLPQNCFSPDPDRQNPLRSPYAHTLAVVCCRQNCKFVVDFQMHCTD